MFLLLLTLAVILSVAFTQLLPLTPNDISGIAMHVGILERTVSKLQTDLQGTKTDYKSKLTALENRLKLTEDKLSTSEIELSVVKSELLKSNQKYANLESELNLTKRNLNMTKQETNVAKVKGVDLETKLSVVMSEMQTMTTGMSYVSSLSSNMSSTEEKLMEFSSGFDHVKEWIIRLEGIVDNCCNDSSYVSTTPKTTEKLETPATTVTTPKATTTSSTPTVTTTMATTATPTCVMKSIQVSSRANETFPVTDATEILTMTLIKEYDHNPDESNCFFGWDVFFIGNKIIASSRCKADFRVCYI